MFTDNATVDYFTIGNNGPVGEGPVFNQLLAANGDHHALRPWLEEDGTSYVARRTGRMIRNEQANIDNGEPIMVPEYRAVPTNNNTATMRKDDWIALDEAILKVAKPRLRVFGDLRAAGLEYTIPDGMGKTVLQTERQTDINAASISMSGLVQGDGDRPQFDLLNMPLPIIHKDFHYDLRQLLASRNGGSPLDTTTAELAARRVAETVEMLTIGTLASYTFGGGSIYGYTNFPSRITSVTGTAPTTAGWTAATTVQDVLNMKQAAFNAFHFGPFRLYCSLPWDQYMDSDYNLYQGQTLRQRLAKIEGIESVDTVDYLTNGFQLILVQQSADTVRAVCGMEITTLQWETHGGMQVNFKVMCILLPQLRADLNGNCGLVHAIQA